MTHLKMLMSGLTMVLLLASGAGADETAAATADAPDEREGFLIGFSLGFGAVFPCDTCADFGGDFHVGAMAGRNLAVLAEISAVGGDDRSNDGLLLAAIAAQYWVGERFWVKAGVGIGEPLEDNYAESERKWGAMAAAGYEVARKGRFAFDLQVRSAFVRDRRSVALNLGFNWY